MATDPLTLEFQQALHHHQSGRYALAESLYRQILARHPNHADSVHMLGMMAAQLGRYALAVEILQGTIALKPHFPEAYNNLGYCLRELGRLEQSVAACRQAIAQAPHFAEAHNNLGNGLRDQGQLEQAVAAYRQAILLNPNHADAYNNLGDAFRRQGQLEQSVAACRHAIGLKPNFSEAYNNLGNALHELGQLSEATAAYQQASTIKPDSVEASYNMGLVPFEARRLEESGAFFRRAAELKPSYADAYNNLGVVLKETARLDEAMAAFKRATELDPQRPSFHGNLIVAQLLSPSTDAQLMHREGQAWDDRFGVPLRTLTPSFSNVRDPSRPLRIGYVSADFREHPVGRCLVPLLEQHDSSQFEIYAYAQVARADAITERLRRCAKVWRSIVRLSDVQLADQIRQDQIDILVDLALHTSGNRLLVFARQPAPVQVSFAGYPGSTGLKTIGYRISDVYLDPPQGDGPKLQESQVEQVLCLPHSFWCYDPMDCKDIPVGPLPALNNGFVTFGCLNNFCKVNAQVLQLWARVLCAVPTSRLLLLSEEGSHRAKTLELLKGHGVEPARVEFVSRRPHRDYLKLYDRVDVGLDSYPYNGHTTSLDGFWMGVPVVTLVGKTPVARAGWSQLSNLKLTELAGHTPEAFVEIAVELANDLERLKALRSGLRQRMEASPLMDAAGFARDIESAYRTMWRNWCNSD